MISSRSSSEKEKIVFTNGVFDIVHPGHIYLLQYARKMGDRLVIGINSDKSAASLGKRPKRPINKQDKRKIVLEAIKGVDEVRIFNEKNPLKLIKEIKPDVLVKGGDYTKDQVVGQKYVEGYGGRVKIVPYLEGFGTSKIIHRIQRGK